MPSPGTEPAHDERIVVGEYIHHTTIEEVCQLLGHDPADVVGVTFDYNQVKVLTATRTEAGLSYVHYRHVVR